MLEGLGHVAEDGAVGPELLAASPPHRRPATARGRSGAPWRRQRRAPMSAPPARARRKAAGSGSRRQASQSSSAVASVTGQCAGGGPVAALVRGAGPRQCRHVGGTAVRPLHAVIPARPDCHGHCKIAARGGKKSRALALPRHCSNRSARRRHAGSEHRDRTARSLQGGTGRWTTCTAKSRRGM